MSNAVTADELAGLVDGLNFQQKVKRSLELIQQAVDRHGERIVVANSLGKDSSVLWHLAKQVSTEIRGFIVTTRYKPVDTVHFMHEECAPCTRISTSVDERAGRWVGTSKCGGECGIHTRPLRDAQGLS